MQRVFCVVLFAALISPFAAAERLDAESQSALTAAQAWLSAVDAGDYAKSWDLCAVYLKEEIHRGSWVGMLEGLRRPHGQLKKRTLVDVHHAGRVPGAPDGKYVLLIYRAVFEDSREAKETLTLKRESDQTWHIASYFIE